jgi:hypothetical protein
MKPIHFVAIAVLFAAAPAFAAGQITCSQLPHAEAFMHKLKAGPNTNEARRHLDMAKAAKSDQECVNELGAANYYAKKSMSADKAADRREAK